MIPVTPLRGRTLAAVLLGVLLAFVLPVGCRGPERAPRQPITGIDRPEQERATNPHDTEGRVPEGTVSTGNQNQQPPAQEPAAAGHPSSNQPVQPNQPAAVPPPLPFDPGSLLGGFLNQITTAVKEQPGIVAVFWPLTKRPINRGGWFVNGLDERLAIEIADGLRSAGITPLAAEGLINDLKARNRSLHDYCAVDDVFPLAERVSALYVVYGTVDLVTYNRLDRDQELDINLGCKRLSDGVDIARLKRRLKPGRTARDLYRDFPLPGSVAICQDAPPIQPSPDLEASILMEILARRIVQEHGLELSGKGVYIEPTSIRGASPERAELQGAMEAFARAFDAAERAASKAGEADPALAALSKGPVEILGRRFETLGAALDQLGQRHRALAATRAGQLATDLGRALSESLRSAGGAFRLAADTDERKAILHTIRSEMEAYSQSDAIDPNTVARLNAQGTSYLIRSTLRPYIRTYQLRVLIYDMHSGTKYSKVINFDERFKADLDAATKG